MSTTNIGDEQINTPVLFTSYLSIPHLSNKTEFSAIVITDKTSDCKYDLCRVTYNKIFGTIFQMDSPARDGSDELLELKHVRAIYIPFLKYYINLYANLLDFMGYGRENVNLVSLDLQTREKFSGNLTQILNEINKYYYKNKLCYATKESSILPDTIRFKGGSFFYNSEADINIAQKVAMTILNRYIIFHVESVAVCYKLDMLREYRDALIQEPFNDYTYLADPFITILKHYLPHIVPPKKDSSKYEAILSINNDGDDELLTKFQRYAEHPDFYFRQGDNYS